MKKQWKHPMRMAGVTLMAMTVLCVADLGLLRTAEAGVRVRAKVRGPYVSVHFDSGQVGARRPFVYRVTARDRVIARKLSFRTGYHRGLLLDMRARGLSWKQIGRRLQIPPRVVRSVVHSGHGRKAHHGRRAGPPVRSGRCGR